MSRTQTKDDVSALGREDIHYVSSCTGREHPKRRSCLVTGVRNQDQRQAGRQAGKRATCLIDRKEGGDFVPVKMNGDSPKQEQEQSGQSSQADAAAAACTCL
eukprot:CAMPEP_0194762024 /NCGR_PEP_ID=MMETSP0323_2-20130528/14619_1 /TAXON_ID=2866 ORGANISM="Crypthecodinium cohnii, Strain Seligo" /NCGR_SAMPLE_ID=MMETSP0323_2 /ASSEMBLY_ACC=CAM_ASM_000346 /LENGTH=101 /DNA_ID=CAMNT_0039684029 /DNA_START=74 /DNA_END=376 /DNA_ORIENTATION=+